jgi:hypothetical protein
MLQRSNRTPSVARNLLIHQLFFRFENETHRTVHGKQIKDNALLLTFELAWRKMSQADVE